MYLIAGLGNPGKKYDNTRHNAGFRTVDIILKKIKSELKEEKFQALFTKSSWNDEKLIILKPLTFMNLSGRSIKEAASFYKIPPENVIVISDDINLDMGAIRVRPKGSSGGHNGLKSVMESLGSDNFKRVRVGVGKKPEEMELSDYVLKKLTDAENTELEKGLEKAALAVLDIISFSTDHAMNSFNMKQQ